MSHTLRMANDIRIFYDTRVGERFVPADRLRPGETEYTIRDAQLRATGKDPDAFRPLSTHELEILVRNNNTCNDWSLFRVQDPFRPELIRNTMFAGLVRISRLEHVSLEHHDLTLAAGISNSQIIACDIGDNCVISNCSFISHYIIGDHCILLNNSEIQVSNHAKFGNGIVMEYESEEIRITIDVMNENGGRAIYPFNGMLPGDAWLWAKFRDRKKLLERFREMTDERFDHRLGRYGMIGRDSVIKHNRIIKDTNIGACAYIKGANKIKNVTLNSSEVAPSQIGEGVELVNGIIGYGCRIFYGCKAVRFVMCDNSALKYGARLIHSVLGENSTVSCCEILNNLIFPAHEQHHNTSFLIASLVKGQSNMAAGATVGSNHTSRAPDGEIEAGRGFWPGLCASLKHSSRFASFCLIAKGDYKYELDIRYPFALIDNDEAHDRLTIAPGWWWYANAYALMRNEHKFKERDRRHDKSIAYEYSPFAPDTSAEILEALALLEQQTGKSFFLHRARTGTMPDLPNGGILEKLERLWLAWTSAATNGSSETAESKTAGNDPASMTEYERAAGALLLSAFHDPLPFEVLAEHAEHSSRKVVIIKPCMAWKSYREMLTWFAGFTLVPYLMTAPMEQDPIDWLESSMRTIPCSPAMFAWENLGGFLVRRDRVEALIAAVESREIETWDALHDRYRQLSREYESDRLQSAWCLLGYLSLPVEEAGGYRPGMTTFRTPTRQDILNILQHLAPLGWQVADRVYESRARDWQNPFRRNTFRNEAEMLAVHGRVEDNSFIRHMRKEAENLEDQVAAILRRCGLQAR